MTEVKVEETRSASLERWATHPKTIHQAIRLIGLSLFRVAPKGDAIVTLMMALAK